MRKIIKFTIEFEVDPGDPDWINWSVNDGMISGCDPIDGEMLVDLVRNCIDGSIEIND